MHFKVLAIACFFATGVLAQRIYTIVLQNERGDSSNYAVFMDPPQFNSPTGNQEAFTNVWLSQFVPPHGNTEVRVAPDYYAWVGTVRETPAPGVLVDTGISRLAHLGTGREPGSTFNMVINHNVPTLEETRSSAEFGVYQINTGTDFTEPNDKFLIGLGMVGDQGVVVPVASTNPNNNMQIQITPKMKFHILNSNYMVGEIVDYTSVVRHAATVDFTTGEGASKYYAVVTHLHDGTFKVQYFDAL